MLTVSLQALQSEDFEWSLSSEHVTVFFCFKTEGIHSYRDKHISVSEAVRHCWWETIKWGIYITHQAMKRWTQNAGKGIISGWTWATLNKIKSPHRFFLLLWILQTNFTHSRILKLQTMAEESWGIGQIILVDSRSGKNKHVLGEEHHTIYWGRRVTRTLV